MSELFSLGRIVATPAAIAAMEEAAANPADYLLCHVTGDWGDLCEEDKAENEYSLSRYLRLLSAYTLPDGVKIWIITEADRSVTTILLPEDY
jgi:hypothetical protein